MEEIQRMVVDYFWSGLHWIKAGALYLPTHEGGQGLIDIPTRIEAFWLQAVQRLLYKSGHSWHNTAGLLLRKVGHLGLDKQLFLLHPHVVELTGLIHFYRSVLLS